MTQRAPMTPETFAALTEIIATGVASGMIDQDIPLRPGYFTDAGRPGEAARIAVHLAASPAAPEWTGIKEPLAAHLRLALRLAGTPPVAGRPAAPLAPDHAARFTRSRNSRPYARARPVPGTRFPVSHWDTAERATPSTAAISACWIPAASRDSRARPDARSARVVAIRARSRRFTPPE